MIRESSILTKRELDVINKRLKNERLTQQDSNYLSKFVRPKLREIMNMDMRLLEKLEYNQKSLAIEKKIKEIILRDIKDVFAIIVFGSFIYNYSKNYEDVDVIVIVKKRFWVNLKEKYKKILEIKKKIKNLDLEIYEIEEFRRLCKSDIGLIYQLKDSKVLYGILKLPDKIEIDKLNLRMKLDYSIVDKDEDLYKAIRNVWLVRLGMEGIIDNLKLNKTLNDELGENLIKKLKNKRINRVEREISYLYLNYILAKTIKDLGKWERKALLGL